MDAATFALGFVLGLACWWIPAWLFDRWLARPPNLKSGWRGPTSLHAHQVDRAAANLDDLGEFVDRRP